MVDTKFSPWLGCGPDNRPAFQALLLEMGFEIKRSRPRLLSRDGVVVVLWADGEAQVHSPRTDDSSVRSQIELLAVLGALGVTLPERVA